jgi:hypothetical protein
VAARGIHVDNVGCVVHFDVAGDQKDYLHRSGRTGRAGAEGFVVTLVTDADRAKVRQLQKDLRLPVGSPVGVAAGGGPVPARGSSVPARGSSVPARGSSVPARGRPTNPSRSPGRQPRPPRPGGPRGRGGPGGRVTR